MVKLHDYGPLIGVPDAFCAPDTVAVYVTLAASELDGVNVATVFPPLTHRPGHAVPGRIHHREQHRARRHRLRERRRRRHRRRHTPVAPELGVTPVTVGGGMGVTAFDGDDACPVPTALVADTVNV